MKKLLALTLLIVFSMGLAGCWSRREIEDLAIVGAIAIDKFKSGEKDKYRFCALVIRPSEIGGKGGQPSGNRNPEWLISETGPTIYEAQRQTSLRSPRTLRLFHSDLTIIGEHTARDGIQPVIDYLIRHKDVRMRTLMFVSRGNASNVMLALPELEQTVSQEISEILLKPMRHVSKSYPVDLKMFLEALVVPGWDAVCPLVEAISPKEAQGPRSEKEPAKSVQVEGLAVFRKDRMVGFLSPDETQGFLLLMGEAERGVLPAHVDRKYTGEISFLLNGSSSEIKPIIRDARLAFEIKIKADADIGEVTGNIPVGNAEVIQDLSKVFSGHVQALAEQTMKKTQKQYKADILGLGNKVHKKYPEYWRSIERDWDKIYPEVPIIIKADGQVTTTREIADPLQVK